MDSSASPTLVRPYRVVRKVRESAVITSFYLEPADGNPLLPFVAGQFLTFRLEGPSPNGVVWRNYSLSGSPRWRGHYRISVKREPSAAGHAPGLVSNHLHDEVDVGDVLWARGPEGRFVLDERSSRPVVLISGGVGLTPLVAMAHALAEEGRRPTRFVHACENGNVHALGAEIRALVAACTNLRTHFCYRVPEAEAVAGRDFDSAGVVTRDLLQALLPLDDYEFYLCGPSAFMHAVFGHLVSLGVSEERIRYEFFGPATIIRAPAAPADTASPRPAVDLAVNDPEAAPVRFTQADLTAAWDDSYECLLDFAEAQGLDPAFSCRAGICSTCMCDLVSGEVDYPVEPLEMPPAGKVLICCAKPRGAVSLAL